MPIKQGFIDKLIERLDKIDPESLQTYFLRLVQDRGLLETIFQSIQEGIIVLDAKGNVTYANRAVEILTGISAAENERRKLQLFIKEVDVGNFVDPHDGGWERMVSREIEIFYPQHRYISFYVVPLDAADESARSAVLILRDVTRDREQEASTIESERMNAVKLLAAGVAHEIGNPLNALNIHLQLLDRELRSADDEQAELRNLVDVCRTEVARLDMIITQFLKAIRPAKPNMAPVRVDSLLQEVLTLMKHDFESRQISVGISCLDDVPDVNVDRDQIKQAFFNVIKNALQALKDGGALDIKIRSGRQYLEVSFRDNGCGISQEDFSHIFDAYYTTKKEGSGLGLMIVQRIIQDHGGQISIKTEPGRGTEFILSLPLVDRQVRLLTHGEGVSTGAGRVY